jgi:hypothetical protein
MKKPSYYRYLLEKETNRRASAQKDGISTQKKKARRKTQEKL